MIAASETAFAKINLALHVRRRDEDGYHAIETLFAFAEDGDILHLTDSPGLTISGPFGNALASSDDNLVLQAARAFTELVGRGSEFGFALDKQLPVAAGIGGGSADAAAALRLLCAQFDLDPADVAMRDLAASLGADVPACLTSRPTRGEGRGDRLLSVEGLPCGQPLLLANPLLPLATARVFGAWDGVDGGPLEVGEPLQAARRGRNDLEAPAIGLCPEISDVLELLRAQDGASLVRMSGSGATCFALFNDDSARDRAANAVKIIRPDWWLLATRLR